MENESKKIKLHLGCGKRNFPGFIHVDKDPWEHVDYQRDIKDLSVFKDNSVDLIYVCHCFNAFDDDEAKEALKEWNRVLKKGGILRIAVPDFDGIVKAYAKFKDLRLVKRLVTGYYEGKSGVDYHKAVYDEKTLRDLLLMCGFSKVDRYDWRKTEHAQYDDYSQAYLPHMDKENGVHVSLNLEAVK
jgi:predicted SAM-dependent methyltransferase